MARSCPPRLGAGDPGGQINPQHLYHPPRFLSQPGPPLFPSSLDLPNMLRPIIAPTRTPLLAFTLRHILSPRLANSPTHVSLHRCNEVAKYLLDPPRHSPATTRCDHDILPTRAPWLHNGKPPPSPCLSISQPSLSTTPSPIHGQTTNCLAMRSSYHPSNHSHLPVTSATLPMHYHPYLRSRICVAYHRKIPPPSSND